MGASMLASTALRQSSRPKSLKSPGGGPPALLIRMSGLWQAASSRLRPSSVVTSQTTVVTLAPVLRRNSSAVALSASAPRAQIVTSTPSRANAVAQPLPRPFDAAQTIAFLPLMPRSMGHVLEDFERCGQHAHAGRFESSAGRSRHRSSIDPCAPTCRVAAWARQLGQWRPDAAVGAALPAGVCGKPEFDSGAECGLQPALALEIEPWQHR